MSEFSTIHSSGFVQNAYGKSRELTGGSAPAGEANKPMEFAEMLQKAAADAVETVRTGDATATAGLTGQAGIQQVVEATMAMESTVKVSVAMRDKLVEAYQEILRMSI